jgi:predicted phage terminase large subunit-like protein
MGEYGFNALFQQRPFARQGMMFLRERVEVVAAAPARAVALCRAWDLAASAGRGDFTASVLIGRLADDRFIVLDAQRKQLGSADRDRWIRQTAELDGNGVQIRLPQEPGAAGRSLAEHLARLLSGFRVVIERITGSKVVRAEPFASQWNAGNVLLLRGDWNRVFLDELCSFPAGRNDDLVDAAADAFSQVAKVGKRPAAW